MKIIKLHAENVKRLKAIDITPDPQEPLVRITGRNAAGKTSVLDSILYALAGERVIPPKPIRDGADKAEIEIDLGELKVKRSITAKGAYLTVENGDGARFNSPQQILNKLYGDLTFDPLEFTRLAQKDQRDRLMLLCGLADYFERFERKRKELFDERTLVNREVKRLEGALTDFGDLPALCPMTVDVADLINLRKARQTEIDKYQSAVREAARLETVVAEQQRVILQMESQLTAARDTLAAAEVLDATPSLDDIDEQIRGAQKTTATALRFEKRNELQNQLEGERRKSGVLTRALDNLEELQAEKLTEANLPIDELSFDEECVTYKGIPFSQASSSEQLRVSLAIAMAANPKLRVIRICDGSLLDSDSLNIVREMAAERDYQVWCESVDETGKVGVVIEDGAVVVVNPVVVTGRLDTE